MPEGATYFRYCGISIPEAEIVYHIISSVLGQVEEEEIVANDNRIPTVIDIHFPVFYGDDFFAVFGADKWYNLRNVITEIKKRRGNKSKMQVVFSFPGVKGVYIAVARLILQLMETDYKNIERAIETVQILVEIIESQISKMPAGALEMIYRYESEHSRWRPAFVKTDKMNYKYLDNSWKILN